MVITDGCGYFCNYKIFNVTSGPSGHVTFDQLSRNPKKSHYPEHEKQFLERKKKWQNEENLRNSLTTKLINIKWLQDEGAIIIKKLELG